MKLLVRAFCVVGFATVLVCASFAAQDISTDYDHSFKFDRMKGYAWGKIEVTDPRLEPRLAASIDRVLQGYGFRESAKSGETASSTDMIVTAVEAQRPQQYAAFYRSMSNLDWHRGWGGGGFSDSASSLRGIHGGTLIVDIYDGATGKLVWRGVSAGGPSGGDKSKQDTVDTAVNSMFANFPPKSGGPMAPNQLPVPESTPSVPRPPN